MQGEIYMQYKANAMGMMPLNADTLGIVALGISSPGYILIACPFLWWGGAHTYIQPAYILCLIYYPLVIYDCRWARAEVQNTC